MANVVLEHVYKIYPGGVTAVHDANLDIKDREFIVLVGPSGCGKSTTLRMVAGLEEISKGTVRIDDRVVNDVPPKDRDIAMVFQNYALYPHMSVAENMAFGLKLRRYPRSEIEKRVRDAADILDIKHLLERKPKALSGGQRQRVAVGRAIVRKPKAFLFDEPLSNLDAKMRVQMRMEISKLHTRLASTMIYVTHDQIEAMTMGDRIVVMKDGFIQQVASPLDIYNHPANQFVAGFIGSPPMNFFKGRIETDAGIVRFRNSSISITLAEPVAAMAAKHGGKDVTLGIRPEDIARSSNGSGKPCLVQSGIEVVEPMGAETYVHCQAGEHRFIARLPGSEPVKHGESFTAEFNTSKAHLFDMATGLNLL